MIMYVVFVRFERGVLVVVSLEHQHSNTNTQTPTLKHQHSNTNTQTPTLEHQHSNINTRTQVLLDFYQVHTYANDLNGRFSTTSPMTMSRDEYQISDKPYVIGEFSATKCESTGCTIESLYKHALSSKYDGAWGLEYVSTRRTLTHSNSDDDTLEKQQ